MKKTAMWTVGLIVAILISSIAAMAQAADKPAAAGEAVGTPAGGLGAGGAQTGVGDVARPVIDRAAVMQRVMAATATTPAIAVAGDYVYVVQGRTLYQFSVNGLKLVAQAQLGPDVQTRAGAKHRGGRKAVAVPAPDAGNPNPAVPAAGGQLPAPAAK